MDRIEPKAGQDLQELTFRRSPRRQEPATDNRFALGVGVFLLVALVYPWYSYWVQTHLLARDVQAGVDQFTQAIVQEAQAVETQIAQQTQQTAERLQQRRISAVRVIGASAGDPPLLIVEMGQASFEEADARICQQGETWLRRSLTGRVIRVQRARATGYAGGIHQLVCP